MFHTTSVPTEVIEDTLLTDRELSDLLGVSRTTLWRLRQRGELPFGKVGRGFRYRKSEILAWVKAGHQSGAGKKGPRQSIEGRRDAEAG